MERYQLDAELRQMLGKQKVKKLKSAGWLPAVMYGRDVEPTPLQVRADAFQQMLKAVGSNVLVDLKVAGRPAPISAMVKKIMRNAISTEIMNVDFHCVSVTDRVTNKVPLELVGEPRGIGLGGVLTQPVAEIEISGVAAEMPATIQADVSNLGLDETLHVRDIVLPEGIEALSPADEVVAAVHAPRGATTAETVEGEAPTAAEGAE